MTSVSLNPSLPRISDSNPGQQPRAVPSASNPGLNPDPSPVSSPSQQSRPAVPGQCPRPAIPVSNPGLSSRSVTLPVSPGGKPVPVPVAPPWWVQERAPAARGGPRNQLQHHRSSRPKKFPEPNNPKGSPGLPSLPVRRLQLPEMARKTGKGRVITKNRDVTTDQKP